jgi:hypothetical protein
MQPAGFKIRIRNLNSAGVAVWLACDLAQDPITSVGVRQNDGWSQL